ncbi:MAG: GTP-dependent dephospho-CoA kinase family protein [Methanomassiliicoccales archaeon]
MDLRMPFGNFVDEKEAVQLMQDSPLGITVGDVVSLTMLDNGLQPHIMIFDFRNERRDDFRLADRINILPGRYLIANNPPGRITPDLVTAILNAIGSAEKVKIKVNGEEDLSSLVVAAIAPNGTCLLYGLPGKGLVHVEIENSVREKARRLIYAMEECN